MLWSGLVAVFLLLCGAEQRKALKLKMLIWCNNFMPNSLKRSGANVFVVVAKWLCNCHLYKLLDQTVQFYMWRFGPPVKSFESLICDNNSVTTQNLWFFKRSFYRFWSAIIFYECNDDTTALQRRVLQIALCMTLYLLKVHLQTFLSIPITQKCQILSCDTLVANERYKNSYMFRH